VEQLEFLRLQHQRDGHPRDRFGSGSSVTSTPNFPLPNPDFSYSCCSIPVSNFWPNS
jgi:hypothetical protein